MKVGDLIQLGEDRFGIEEKYGDEFIVTQNDSRSIYIFISPISNNSKLFSYRPHDAKLLFRPDIGRRVGQEGGLKGTILAFCVKTDRITFGIGSISLTQSLTDFYKKVIKEFEANPLVSVFVGTCPECNGKKKVVLFTSIQPCSLCCKKQEQGLPEGVSWI